MATKEWLKAVLTAIYSQEKQTSSRDLMLEGDELLKLTSLTTDELNDAIDEGEANGLLSVMHVMGTHPYEFGPVSLTSRGRASIKTLIDSQKAKDVIDEFNKKNSRPITPAINSNVETLIPIGSPFGFNAEDWEYVRAAKANSDEICIVFGHQWDSTFYDKDILRKNVQKMFEDAYSAISLKLPNKKIKFINLRGGYGSHVFNKIARDIIAADIAVFETSDNNSNVMIELGVALTWGIRSLPIFHTKLAKTPSDISGLHWTRYDENGSKWEDGEHRDNLKAMLEEVIIHKPTKRKSK